MSGLDAEIASRRAGEKYYALPALAATKGSLIGRRPARRLMLRSDTIVRHGLCFALVIGTEERDQPDYRTMKQAPMLGFRRFFGSIPEVSPK